MRLAIGRKHNWALYYIYRHELDESDIGHTQRSEPGRANGDTCSSGERGIINQSGHYLSQVQAFLLVAEFLPLRRSASLPATGLPLGNQSQPYSLNPFIEPIQK